MKKVLVLVLFLTTMLFSAEFENPKSVVRPGTKLRFAPDYLSFEFGESCSKKFIQCSDSVYIDQYFVFNGIAYYSSVDTNFVVFVNFTTNDIIIHSVQPCVGCLFGDPLEVILKQEFLNLQEWGVVQLTKDSAQSLIDRMIEIMSCGSYSIDGVYHYQDLFCDTSTTFYCCEEQADGGAAMIDNWWTLLPDEKPTSVSKTPIKNRFRLSRMNHETFFVEGINEATPYKIFDVNGILLKQGITENGEVCVPKTPAILDIGHQKILLK